jgi:hypothetical protein
MVERFSEAITTDDVKAMQKVAHKFIPSMKMLGVSDVWLDLTLARQMMEGGTMTPESGFAYLAAVKEKVKTFLDGLAVDA